MNPEEMIEEELQESEIIDTSEAEEFSEKPASFEAAEDVDVLRRMDMNTLERMRLPELRDLARHYEVSGFSGRKKDDLILLLLKAKAEREGFSFGGGILEVTNEGIGFLRSSEPTSVTMEKTLA